MNTQKIIQEQQNTAQRILKTRSFLKTAPEGHIVRSKRPSGWFYFSDVSKDCKRTRKYIGGEDSLDVFAYIKKAYYQKLLEKLEWNYKATQYFLKHYNSDPERVVLDSLPEWMAERIKNDASTDRDTYISEWLKADYKKNTHRADALKIQTSRGEFVRSKGEREIANALFRKGLAYRTDCEVQLTDGTIYADFAILHPITLELYYWEHSGMLGDPSYTQANYDRIARYANSGYLIGERLIMTGENSDHVIGSQAIDRIIEAYFGV